MSEWNAKTAEWYAANYGEYATNRLAVDALEDLSPTVVLDVGCGTGAALRRASERWSSARLVGIDPVPRMIEIAKERLQDHPGRERISLRLGSADAIPLDDASADVVLALDSLDHWADRQAGATEIARVLRAGGSLVVVKDADVPEPAGGLDATTLLFGDTLAFELTRHDQLEGEGVRFSLWVFARLAETAAA